MKYHYNSKTGRANICKATKGPCPLGADTPHFNTKEEAKNHILKEAKNSHQTFNKITKPTNNLNEDHMREREATRDLFRRLNYKATLAKDLKISFYHEIGDDSKTPPKTIRSFDEKYNGNSGMGKPAGVLWLSSGDSTVDGKVVSGWRNWSHDNSYGADINDYHKTYELKLKPDALILELDDNNVGRINNILDENEPIFNSNPDGNSFMAFMNTPRVNWGNLQRAGVDAVRINGEYNRGYFYGYDVDSLIILNGDKVEGFQERESVGAEELDNFYNTSENHSYNMDIEGNPYNGH